jgi:DNA-binding CsgD family transcriptional regulator
MELPFSARRALAVAAGHVLRSLLASRPPEPLPNADALTRREREVTALAALGLPNAEIAARLEISVRTVESHLYHAMLKLGVDRRTDLPKGLCTYAGQSQ